MDFKKLSDQLGGCIFPDCLSINLEKVHDEISVLGRQRLSPPEQAALQLTTAVFRMVQGNFKEASVAVQKLRSISSTLSVRWQTRAKAYSYLAEILRRFPLVLRFRPDNEASSSILADATYELRTATEGLTRLLRQAESDQKSECSPLDKLELQCLVKATTEYNEFLWIQGVMNPEHPNAQMRQRLRDQIGDFDSNMFTPDFIAELESHHLHAVARYFENLNVQAGYTRGASDANNAFLRHLQRCISNKDYFSCAAACVMLGDENQAPFMTSPLALNLITHGTFEGYEVRSWDTTDFEERHRLLERPASESRYGEALNVFAMLNCERGRGALYLRKACILHVSGVVDLDASRTDMANEKLKQAAEQLRLADEASKLDDTYKLLTKAHRVLLDVTTGRINQSIDAARAIGEESKRLDNRQVAYFIATLMLRFGRRRWLDGGRTDVLLLCVRCAESCLQGCLDETGVHQAQSDVYLQVVAIALAKAQHEVGSVPAALEALEIADSRFAQALASIQNLQTARTQYGTGLGLVRMNLTIYHDRVAEGIRPRASDPAAVITIDEQRSQDVSPLLPDEVFKSKNVLSRLSRAFSKATGEAEVALQDGHFDKYITRIEELVSYITARFDVREQAVAGFHVRALCMLDRYDQARLALPHAVAPRFGGSGNDSLFQAVTSRTVEGGAISLPSEHILSQAEGSIGNCVWAKHWSMAGSVLMAVVEALPEYLIKLSKATKPGTWQAQAEVGAICEHNGRPEEALRWYMRAADGLERQRGHTLDVSSRLESMNSMNSSELFGGLIRVCRELKGEADANEGPVLPTSFGLPGIDWNAQAFLFAEQARARLLLDMLTASSSQDAEAFDLWRRQSHAYRQYEDLKYNKRPGSGSASKAVDRPQTDIGVERLWSVGYQLLSKATFQQDLTSMLRAIGSSAILLHYSVNDEGTIVFVVTSDGIVQTRSMHLGRRILQKRVLEYQRLMFDSKPYEGCKDRGLANEICAFFAKFLLTPFQDLLRDKTHVILSPSHELHAFPMQSMPLDGKPLLSQKSVSVVPSLAVLDRLASCNGARASIQAAVFANREEKIQIPNMGATAIAEKLSTRAVVTNETTQDSFLKSCQNANLIFISTHGCKAKDSGSSWQAYLEFKPRSETVSGTSLTQREPSLRQGDPLKVLDLTKLRTKAAVTIFSACLGAVGEITKGNDLIGFSHAMLESGSQAYVGALWSVADWATMILMMLFTDALADTQRKLSVAECLQQAQVQFQQLDEEKAKTVVDRVRDSWDRSKNQHRVQWYNECRFCLDDLVDDLEYKDFTDPYYWAPWVIVGNGDVRLINSTKPALVLPTTQFDGRNAVSRSSEDLQGIERVQSCATTSSKIANDTLNHHAAADCIRSFDSLSQLFWDKWILGAVVHSPSSSLEGREG